MIDAILSRRHIQGVGVHGYEDLQLEQLRTVSKRLGLAVSPHVVETPVLAYINHGRWLADCIGCRSGMVAEPSDPICRCMECGAVFTDVSFPSEREAIERELLRRPDMTTRNWLVGETVDDLAREYAEHGGA